MCVRGSKVQYSIIENCDRQRLRIHWGSVKELLRNEYSKIVPILLRIRVLQMPV
jgi:hypothetical protein